MKGDQAKGFELWMSGLEEMRRAVDLAPDNVGVRIPRGAVLLQSSLYLPSKEMALPLIKDGVSDYQRTLDLQEDHFATLGTHPRGELLMGLADGYSRLGDQEKASALFARIQKDLPNTVYAKRAALWTENKTLTPAQVQCVGCHVPGK
jgi:hypothetical protein